MDDQHGFCEYIEWFNNVVRPKTDGYQQVSDSVDPKEFDR